ncbi:41232_t:CDS:1, partial [Gigaspora margarita]
ATTTTATPTDNGIINDTKITPTNNDTNDSTKTNKAEQFYEKKLAKKPPKNKKNADPAGVTNVTLINIKNFY